MQQAELVDRSRGRGGEQRNWPAITAAAALSLFVLLSIWLAVAPAVVDSEIVLATAGGSPDWLLGIWRFAGADSLAGSLAGEIYYAVLMLAMVLYAVIVALAPRLSGRLIWSGVIGLHIIFLLAPPLLSQDAFSYIAYARLGVEHGFSPFTHRPFDIPLDAVFPFAGSKDAVNVYGPFFTLLAYPLAWLSVPTAFWTIKATMAAASLALVRLVDRLAARTGDSKRAVVIIGLCPATLVHVVGGAHNEALTMLLVVLGIAIAQAERPALGGFVATLAAGIKASAIIPLPFLLAASTHKLRMLLGMVSAALITLATALIAFGGDSLNALNLISSNQDRTSRYSLPQVTVDGLDRVVGSLDRVAATDAVRLLFVLILAAVVIWLLLRSWRRPETWIANAGWATLGVLIASAWLVPWYLLWLLPFTALARNHALTVATIIFAGYTMAIAIPF